MKGYFQTELIGVFNSWKEVINEMKSKEYGHLFIVAEDDTKYNVVLRNNKVTKSLA